MLCVFSARAEEPWEEYALDVLPAQDIGVRAALPSTLAGVLPERVDLSRNVPPIGDQGREGSCLAWALGYYYRGYQERIERRWSFRDPAHLFSPSYLYNQRRAVDCATQRGMSFPNGLELLQERGIAPLTTFSAADPCTQPPPEALAAAQEYRIASFAPLYMHAGEADIMALRGLLAREEVFAIMVRVHTGFYRVTPSAPVVNVPESGESYYGRHALLVIGYDDALGAFRVANSWGADWGAHGYAYVSYDYVLQESEEGWIMKDIITDHPALPTYSLALPAVHRAA
jgi:C1A family cysteine protease